MSENLNEMVHVIVEDASVITVPIDATLTKSNEAADAKAVGDRLALKADKSELQTAITVNGQEADAQGAILVDATDIPLSSSDQTTVKAKLEAVDGKTAADIPVSSDPGAQTIAQALSTGATRTADQIAMSETDTTTVKQAVDTIKGDVSDLEEAVGTLGNKTAADIKYNTGSNETIKEHVDAIDQGLVKTVNNIGPDQSGNVDVKRVPYADNLYSEDGEQVDDSFLIRTTAGSGSLSDGNAWVQKMLGNRVHSGYVAESIAMTVNAMPRTTPAAITVSIDQAAFAAAAETAGTYEFEYTNSWDVNPTSYGLTVSNTPVNGDEIVVVWDGENDAVVTVNAVPRTAPPAITATIDRDTWVAAASASGTYTFTYTTGWNEDLADYGITVTNDPIAGDQIVVVYVKEVRGSIAVATPSALVATGWNIYDHTNGYARVVKYSNVYGYAISGTYTSLVFKTNLSDTGTPITPDEDGLFNVSGTGYVVVTGGNNTDTAIWCTWSDWDEGYAGSWQAYSESVVNLAAIMSANFPYGLCKVGDVCDEIDFVHKQAISRISRVAYSDEARAAAEASGRPYEFDEDYIYQVRATAITNSITIDEEYTVSEHGLEWFAGTTVAVYSEILYGSNLKDKLRRDVVTLSEQTLTDGQKRQVLANIGAGTVALEDGLAIVVDGNKTAHIGGAASGDYVLVKNSSITDILDGGYTAAKAIPANTVIDKTYLTPCSKGIANSLSEQITTWESFNISVSSKINSGYTLNCRKHDGLKLCAISFAGVLNTALSVGDVITQLNPATQPVPKSNKIFLLWNGNQNKAHNMVLAPSNGVIQAGESIPAPIAISFDILFSY